MTVIKGADEVNGSAYGWVVTTQLELETVRRVTPLMGRTDGLDRTDLI